MLWYVPVIVYAALACATVKPPPGTAILAPTPAAAASAPPPHVSTRPAWDFLGVCTMLNEQGVQKHPSLSP